MKGGLGAFLAELKRRKVYHVAAAYVAVGLGIAATAPDLFAAFDLPSSAARLVVVFVVLGFPLALVLAWAYEVRPEEARGEEVARSAGPAADAEARAPEPASHAAPAFVPPHPSLPDDPRPSLAVLPFAAFSDDKEADYFGLGVMEDVLTRLAHVKGIRLCSRTSTMRYRAAEKSTREIAQELGVRTVLEGSVRRAGGRVRIVAQLIDGVSDEHLWADTYDRELEDIFHVQTEVAESIAVALKAELTPQEREGVRRIPTENLEAWDLYVRAIQKLQELVPSEIAEAQAHLEIAIRLDPAFAQAWAGLAMVRVFGGLCANERPSEFWPKIREAASRALELNPRCSEAHTAQGVLRMFYEWDPQGAEEEFDRAHRLDPDNAFPLGWRAVLLAFTGRHAEALATARQGVAAEPLWAMAHVTLGQVLLLCERPEEAAEALESALRIWPRCPQLHVWRAYVHAYVVQGERALVHWDIAIEVAGGHPHFEALRAMTLASLGRTAEARAVLEDLKARSKREYVDPFAYFCLTLAVEGMDAAAPYLEEMLKVRSFLLPYLSGPRFRPLRADPRFRAALERVFPGVAFEA